MMHNEKITTQQENWLVLRAQTGDVSAWNALLLATQGWLYRFLNRLLQKNNLTDEVLQEVFLLIFRKLKFLHEPRAYRSWVYRIATRQAFRHISRERKRLAPTLSGESLDGVQAVEGADEHPNTDWLNRIGQEIEVLSPNTRSVIVLHYYEGLSIRQVADVLDIAVGTAKSRLAHGLARLRKQIPIESA